MNPPIIAILFFLLCGICGLICPFTLKQNLHETGLRLLSMRSFSVWLRITTQTRCGFPSSFSSLSARFTPGSFPAATISGVLRSRKGEGITSPLYRHVVGHPRVHQNGNAELSPWRIFLVHKSLALVSQISGHHALVQGGSCALTASDSDSYCPKAS